MRQTAVVRDEHGSTLPMFGALVFTSFVVVALAVELAMVGATYRSAAAAADAAAEAGAAMVAPDRAYDDEIVLDVDRAWSESLAVGTALARPGAAVEVDATLVGVCVTVRDRYVPATLGFLGSPGIDIAVDTCAEPRVG